MTRLSDPREEPLPSFEVVYEVHAADIYRFCLAQLRDPHAAEDATADVFAAALGAYGRVQPVDGVKFWLLRIARNTVVSRWRQDSRRNRLGSLLRSRGTRAVDVQEEAEIRSDLRAVISALGHLRPRDRVLIGFRAAHLSSAEVALFMGISENAAKVATHRALKALRARMEES